MADMFNKWEKFFRDMQDRLTDLYNDKEIDWMPERKSLDDWYRGFRAPVCDIRETDDNILIDIELPGVDKEDIDLDISKDSIEVKAEKQEESSKEETYNKRKYSFYRKMNLPTNADSENVQAKFENAVLHINLPKIETDKNKVEIE